MACLVRMSDDVLLLHSWDNIIYSVYEHDFESPWLWDVHRTRGNSYISFAIVDFYAPISGSPQDGGRATHGN